MSTHLGIIFGIISMIGFGMSTAFTKEAVKRIGPKQTLFWRGVLISIILLVVLFFFLEQTNFSTKYIIIAFLISLIGYVPLVYFYKALEVGKIGAISPIGRSSLAITVILSVIFFNERLSQLQLLAIFLILAGVLLMTIKIKDFKNSSLFKKETGVPYALVTCVGWGLVFFLFKIPVVALGAFLAVLLTEFGQTVWAWVHLKINNEKITRPDKKTWQWIFWVALGGAVGGIFFNLGIKIANVSIVTAITSSTPIIVVLYGKLVYKERLRLAQYIAVVLILVGIVFISI